MEVSTIRREDVIGQRIADVFGDSSQSDPDLNFTDFVYLLRNGVAFRLPSFDDPLDFVELNKNHKPLKWPKVERWRRWRKVWTATICDILIPVDPDERIPDSAVISLSSGWYVSQLSSGPIGIMPAVFVLPEISDVRTLTSVWT